jgi:hypothetical protein
MHAKSSIQFNNLFTSFTLQVVRHAKSKIVGMLSVCVHVQDDLRKFLRGKKSSLLLLRFSFLTTETAHSTLRLQETRIKENSFIVNKLFYPWPNLIV